MRKVPITRFKREIRKWIRKQEAIEITRRGESVFIFLPVETYNSMINLLNKPA